MRVSLAQQMVRELRADDPERWLECQRVVNAVPGGPLDALGGHKTGQRPPYLGVGPPTTAALLPFEAGAPPWATFVAPWS